MRLQRLNMDNSWWLEFANQRILIDPWLQGVEIDFFSWFNMQWHKTKPLPFEEVQEYDFVLITQKYPDHFHEETLLKLQPKKIVVPSSLLSRVKKLLPQSKVIAFDKNEAPIFKSELNIHFFATSRKIDPIYDALIIENGKESVFIATHGFTTLADWDTTLQSIPPVKLAFTPFNRYELPFFLGGTVSPGLDAVKKMIEIIEPAHIVATHDEDKHAKGIVDKFAKITFAPSKEELQKESIFQNRLLTIENYKTHQL